MDLLVSQYFVRPLLNHMMQQSKPLKALYRKFVPLVLTNFKVFGTRSQRHLCHKDNLGGTTDHKIKKISSFVKFVTYFYFYHLKCNTSFLTTYVSKV